MNNTSISKILWALSPAKFFFTLSVISLFTFSSCNKSSILGLEVQPPNDMINGDFQDTLTLLTRTVKEDSLKTSGQLVAVIGKLYDPVMGETNAGIYTQLRMIAGAPVFGKNPKCDSVRLTLMYKNSYGKKVRKQQVMSVYELTEDMGDILTTYYSDHKLNYNPADLANFTFTPRPTDSVYTDTSKIKRAPRLHVPLLKDFGQKILDKQGATELATNANFYQFMKGFKITTENTTGLAPEEGNLLLLDISASTLDIFYKYEKDTINHKDTTASYSFTFAAVTRYMKYDHDFTKGNADFQKQMVQSSPPLTNDVCYAQGLAGVKTRIKIPYLTQWGRKELIGINRAELIVKA
ncbi:MAG TPA: DUF4270 family protein, partial [Bacteroidia bacterium]|nr:DUF4270 family protein [Bacteroidia bacterium]